MAQSTSDKAVETGGAFLFRLARSLVAMENGEIRCCGVTTGQAVALLAMKRRGEVTMRQVAEALGVSAGTATRVIDNLVRDGLAERTENPRDRRNVCVRPTAQGNSAIRELNECYARFWEMTFSGIPRNRLRETLAALELLVYAVEKAREVCCTSPRSAARRIMKGGHR